MRNLHRITGALERNRHEAATGPCGLPGCSDRAVGYVESWDIRQTGVCAGHRAQGERLGYTVHLDPWLHARPEQRALVDRLYDEWLHAQAAHGKDSAESRAALNRLEAATG
jgi:hypothetical protein